jgi:hypothetical protein
MLLLSGSRAQQTALDSLSVALGERFRFQVDHRDPSRPARFVAIAHARHQIIAGNDRQPGRAVGLAQ